MNQLLSKFFLHWFVLIFLAYLGLVAVQNLVIMPIETMLVERNVALVSLLYLPHAVRVLGAWMVGPKSILALIPASIIVYFVTRPDTGPSTQADIIIPMIGALCAPVAFELMRVFRIDVYPKSTGVISWRTLVFAGLFSSIINSFFSTLFLEGRFPIEDTFDVLTRFIIGDVMGLVLVLLILVGLLKTSRRFVRV
ncbi:hypothetical protein N9K58_06605 [Alphaproteobacteria bacterium]|jgi:hypothetical protein|nr:hypothetical protein [Alphaproteobacteria bacterium]MDA9132918.1 hypothetical protein [Alphaproteobacteria bacterium]MDA9825189.1 hypothetical protein [Alphaproteobacteria bacterium]MDG2489299.1 hypothetical protein [Alphaproteobacteria bacterium]